MRESVDELSWIGITVSGRTLNNLRYADDIVLIATSPAALQQLLDKVSTVSKEYGLEVSTRKTKVMVTAEDTQAYSFTCSGDQLEQVDSFRYLGAMITSSGECSTEIRARLGMARSATSSLTTLWKDRSLSNEMKMRLMNALVWPVATYGCESWTLRAVDMKRISGFEMTAYRRMLRISWRDHRTNQSILEQLDTSQQLLKVIQRRKLQYFGHLVRADNLSTFILHGRINGKRRRGRPRRRWTDDIKEWTGLSIVDCLRTARDRTAWRTLVSLVQAVDPQT